MTDLLLTDAAEVVTYADHERLERVEDAAVAVEGGRVVAVGPTDEVTAEHPESDADEVVDCSERAVVPGFVDPHTHALFAGDRSDEFEEKLRGKTYQEILADGGGILRTVDAVREASTEELVENLTEQFDAMLAHGTTTVEVKSGYGLDRETELRMLEAIDRAAETHPIRVVPTFMGAHAVPRGRDADDYVEEVATEQIPAVAEQGVAEFCDVFCEEGVFDVEQSRRVLAAGTERSLKPKVHAEELSHLGGTELAAEVGATSADHLLHATAEDIDALVDAGVTPVLLPGTAFGLGSAYADAETFLDRGAPVALATDLNPNCYSQSMPFAMTLGCVEMGLTPAQALGASTVNAARAVDRPDAGRLEPGSPADFAVLDAPSYVYLSYNFGVNAVDTVVVGGETVVDGGTVVDREVVA
ncbi:imidazolonepropionase [Halogeometricum pallidum]|uniref:imidazolonepropionase n=1 Tax=Halogeometricum pallidum TaxID=411361 RepID=UPI00067762FC|nr:imidazolonepropionase [Halogeometricum pallidum]